MKGKGQIKTTTTKTFRVSQDEKEETLIKDKEKSLDLSFHCRYSSDFFYQLRTGFTMLELMSHK